MSVEQNIYGVDLAMNPNGDLAVSAAGDLGTVGETQVMAQALMLRIRTQPGDLTLHPEYGMDLPVGGKMDPVATGAELNGKLAQVVKGDPRLRRATVTNVSWPANGNYTALVLTVTVELAGGVLIELTGLPSELRSSEAVYGTGPEGEAGLFGLEEQPYFATDEGEVQIIEESAIERLVNDLPGG